MSVRRVKNHGKWVWQARVAYRGLRRAAFRSSKDEARQVEGELLAELREQAGKAEAASAEPVTLRALFEFYVADLESRGKGKDTLVRAAQTAHVVERLMPALLDKPVSEISEADVFAFRAVRAREGSLVYDLVDGERRPRKVPTKPSTINRDLRTLRAMFKRAMPDYRFPARAFFPEDETRVRWLRPDEELLLAGSLRSPFRELAQLASLTLMRLSEARCLRRESRPLGAGRDHAPTGQGGRQAGDPERRRAEDRPRPARGPPGERMGVPEPGGQALRALVRRPRVPSCGPVGWPAGLPLPRPPPPRGDDGTQPRLHGADRDGPRRVEDGTDDAPVRGDHGCDPESGGRGRQWQRAVAADA